MAPSFDHALGQRLAQLIQQSGEEAFEAGVLSRRLQAQLQDLLGAETALLNPLRDLLQRPAFRQLVQLNSQGQILNGRDALLRDLAEVYSPAVVARLDAVLQGCLNLPGAATPWPTAQPASAPPPPAPSPMAPSAAPATTVVTIPVRSQAPTAILIALLALLCGALVMALAGVLVSSRGSNGTTSATPAPSPVNPSPSQPPSQPAAAVADLPLQAAEPSDSQLRQLLNAWLEAKAALLAGEPSNRDLQTLARPAMVSALERQLAENTARGERERMEAAITSLSVEERSASRLAAAVVLRYSDARLDRTGKVLSRTPSSELRSVYVFGRDGDTWRLAAFRPDR